MKKQLKDLSISECYELFEKGVTNSERRWRSAKLLADDSDYGGAIRDLITSIEEIIKAVIMLADSKGFEFRKAEGMEAVIQKSHSLRHLIGFSMFILNIFFDDLKNLIIRFRENPSEVKFFKQNKAYIQSKASEYLLRKIRVIKEEFEWFSKVEKVRQQSAHVDIEETIKTPLNITLEEYNQVLLRMGNVKLVAKEIIEIFKSEDPEILQDLEEMKIKFHDERFYEKIQNTLINTNKSRKNPFDLLKKGFSDLDLDFFK